MHDFVIFGNKYPVWEPLGDAHGCLDSSLLIKAGNADAAKSGQCLVCTLDKLVDTTDSHTQRKQVIGLARVQVLSGAT